MHCSGSRGATTSCFALVVVVRCFGDVVLCFVRRRRTSCFASTTRSAFRSRSGWFALRDVVVLCSVTAKYAASASQFPCVWFVFAFAPSLSLGGGPCLSLPCFSCSFLAGRSQSTAGTGTPTACIRSMCLLLLAFSGAASPATENFCALRAAFCSPRYK